MTDIPFRTEGRSGPPGPAPAGPVWRVPPGDLAATEAFGRLIAEELRPGDLVTLSGGRGAGKTALARSLVRAVAGDPELEVPSPTFPLMQVYDTPHGAVVRAEFCRLSGAQELYELGWDEITDSGIALVEWPERAEEGLKPARLDIALDLASSGSRHERIARLTATGATDRKSTRLNSSHANISYAVFCL